MSTKTPTKPSAKKAPAKKAAAKEKTEAKARPKPKGSLNYVEIGKRSLHPVQEQILTLMLSEDISPVQANNALGNNGGSLSKISYHFKALADPERWRGEALIKLVGTRPRRGATEHIYGLTATAKGK